MEQFFESADKEFSGLSNIHKSEVIKIIGVGGGGCNAIDNMISGGIKHVDFIAANTDYQSLSRTKVDPSKKLQLGVETTKGLGAGTLPDIGKKSALEQREQIIALLKGTDMLFITAGMGGGTGTGAAPVIADIARSLNILTVGVVTRPFDYEGVRRRQIAEEGIKQLSEHVDSLIVIPNEKLMTELDEDVSLREAFAAADDVLKNAVAGITEVIKTPGIISLDFADVRTIMAGRGFAMMGSGNAQGQNRAREAVEKAIFSPLLDDISLNGAKGVLVNVSSAVGSLKMREYNEIIGIISDHIDPNADFKPGMAEIENMAEDEIRVTVIATGLSSSNSNANYFNNKPTEVASNNDKTTVEDSVNQDDETNDSFSNFNQTGSAPAFFRRKR